MVDQGLAEGRFEVRQLLRGGGRRETERAGGVLQRAGAGKLVKDLEPAKGDGFAERIGHDFAPRFRISEFLPRNGRLQKANMGRAGLGRGPGGCETGDVR